MKQPLDQSENDQSGLQSLRYPRLDFSSMSSLTTQHEMNPDLGFDDTSDSTYEIISQDSFHNSDDESHDDCTDSVTSLSDDNREIVSAILDRDNSSTETTRPDLRSESLEGTVIEESLSTPSLSSTGFGLSPLPSEPFLDLPPDWVNFKESISRLGNRDVDVSHTIQYGSRRDGQTLPTITINQTMSKRLLKVEKPLHIVYCGNAAAKHDIIEKMAEAVAASLRVSFGKESPYSKLQIVPLSSFGHDNPNAQVTTLPSTGLEMFVSDCTGYLAVDNPRERPNEMYYEYCYPDSLRSGERDEIQSKVLSITCRRPDIALITHNDADPSAISWQQSHAFARLRVPVIDINEIGFGQNSFKYASEKRPSTGGAVHMRLKFPESHKMVTLDVPIDLSTFLSIDPRQLNRNVAYLASLNDVTILQPKRFVAGMIATLWSHMSYMTAFINKRAQKWNDCFERQIPVGFGSTDEWNFGSPKVVYYLPLLFALCSILMLAQYSAVLSQSTRISDLAVSNQTSTHTSQSSATLGLITFTPTATSTGKTQKLVLTGTQIPATHTEYLVSTVTKTIQLPTVAKLLPSDTLDFWLYKTNEGRLFLHSAKKLPKKWQPPKDWIEVSQGKDRAAAVFTKFNESTYELHVDVDGTCEPLTVVVQPSKGQHAQKIFQLHDSSPCEPKKLWAIAALKLTAWRLAIPTQLQSTSAVVTSKTRDVIGNAKSSLRVEVSKIANWAQTSFTRCNTALHAGSKWIPRYKYKALEPISFPSVTEAPPVLTKNSFPSLRTISSTVRELKVGISRSADNVAKSTARGCQNLLSSYLRRERVIWASLESQIRTNLDTLRKDFYSKEKFMKKNGSSAGLTLLNKWKTELHYTKDAFRAEISKMYTAVTWWSKNTLKNISHKMPRGSPATPLKTARNRILSLSTKAQSLELRMRHKVGDLLWRPRSQSPDPHEIGTKNVPSLEETKATWRRVLRLQ